MGKRGGKCEVLWRIDKESGYHMAGIDSICGIHRGKNRILRMRIISSP
jgi:hypothetical protein